MAEVDQNSPDPLRLNLKKQALKLLDQLPPENPHAVVLKDIPSHHALLDTVSTLLYIPQYTMLVSRLFRPALLDLCARWLDQDVDLLEKFESLCLLLEVHPELYPVLAALLHKAPFHQGPLLLLNPATPPGGVEPIYLQRLLLSYYRLLHANRVLPRNLGWSLTPLAQLIWSPHLHNGVRILAVKCYALQAGMAEVERLKMEKEALGEVAEVNCPIAFGVNPDGSVHEVDGWVLPVLEQERIASGRSGLLEPEMYYIDQMDSSEPIHPAELSPLIANIHGVLLLRASSPLQQTSPLIDTPTSMRSLRDIALHLSMRVPILLTSSPSSGKSLLVSHISQAIFPSSLNHIVTIHLADTSLDPRSLLGSYVSSPTRPGTFEWKEGVLVRAMREGKWVVFKDIDRATMEILGIIKPLVESLGAEKWVGGRARLNVPNRGTVEAEETFALFATRSVQPSRKGTFAPPAFFGAHKFYEIVVDTPSASDLRTIIDAKFPRLAGITAQAAINLWEGLRTLGTPSSTRDVGLRELEKFCTRVTGLLPPSSHGMDVDEDFQRPVTLAQVFNSPALREDIFLEARDVFFGAGASTVSGRAHLDAVAKVTAEHLGLSDERTQWILNSRTPEFDLEKDVNGRITAVRAGRVRLPARTANVDITPPPTRPFAMHRPAASLITRLAAAVSLAEPVLLTGETGTGKTSVVTHLASLLRRPLISLNLSNQTESSDILGGFKPVDARIPGSELQERFLELFGKTFSRKKNAHFEESVRKAVQERKWKRAAGLWLEAVRLAKDRIRAKQAEEDAKELQGDTPRKRRKVDGSLNVSMEAWQTFESDVQTFEVQHVQGKSKFAFSFVEGPLVKALRNGEWILLDEVNLATSETLESISGLLYGPTASITLTEQGSLEPVPRHPDFRLFACMNPATDVGKKDLPPNIRSRFTEIDVPPPDADKETLLTIVAQYIGACAVGDRGAIMDVAEFYTAVKRLAEGRQIADGANHRPHFSMRTLARALTFASDMASSYSLRRALWEGCLMAFTMALDGPSAAAVTVLAQKHILAGVRNPRSLLSKEPLPPGDPSAFVKFGPFYLERGPLPEDLAEDYIMTPSVETKLIDLARIIAAKRFPVLIEGPTSSGKTSSIEYLAKRTGHRFVRINNHEHTDIQEYIGTYVSDPITGKLVFKEGLLVRALRQGDWIVLDELNLAPTDVLEALNRLLDDNRELVVPETQEVVRPHPHFMLFATQNPPGLYAGRKVLSRAFRNRFLEVHFEDVPQAELETILCQRCRIAPSYGQRIVSVFRELQKRRQTSRVFESKQGFATLRDLFRWAGRDAVGYEELAANGYMLLAERARRDDDKAVVKEVIEAVMKVRIDESSLYDLQSPKFDPEAFLGCPVPSSSQVVWTAAMQRLFVLTARALKYNEPVLLVGETGCGKTSVCQLYAEVLGRMLRSVNCHQNTETADLIGGLRPIRNKAATEAEVVREAVVCLSQLGVQPAAEDAATLVSAIDGVMKTGSLRPEQSDALQNLRARLQRLSALFEWRDGPLVEAMRDGDVFLMDEISLADDSVLERLNSVLEIGRTIVLAECGGGDTEIPEIRASDKFKLVATMNPGGDYGKKELSPALRNRFTEVWVPAITERQDLEFIVETLWRHDVLKAFTKPLLDFVEWLCCMVADSSFANLRDILAWVSFSNAALEENASTLMTPSQVFHHAAQMTFLDGLGSMPQLSSYSKAALERFNANAVEKLNQLVPLSEATRDDQVLSYIDNTVRFGTFSIPRGPQKASSHNFSLSAPTTWDNVVRVVRASQLLKPIMLEGSPGVGKTSLVAALANMCGYHLCRINLSDQTDLVDLFGSDLPVEGGEPGQFAWKDAEFLRALQEGHWVLLDEMNLAPQSVLEGLNAVLDHRGTVYIPELGRSFIRHPSFRIFAAQNPLHQGGGRKGLPKSFLNRFTKVYVQEMSAHDLLLICRNLFPQYPPELLEKMIAYMTVLNEETMVKRSFGREGAPWEFNLRDVIRWATLLQDPQAPIHPSQYLSSVILQRFRTVEDRHRAHDLFSSLFPGEYHVDQPFTVVSPSFLQVGHYAAERSHRLPSSPSGRVMQTSLSALESLGMCIKNGWLAILTGPKNSGKTTLVKTIAELMGKMLQEVSINNATDATDILGSFEETDFGYHVAEVIREVLDLLDDVSCLGAGSRYHTASDYTAIFKSLSSSVSSVDLPDVTLVLSRALEGLQDLPEPQRSRKVQVQADVQRLSSRRPQAAQLEWVDGPLVRALKEGHWLLLDGANLCNPSVLDRLNSLCEIGGSLTLNERGAVNGEVQVLRPHPDFRLFMCSDGQYGELSRAMRNRGLEVSLTSAWSEEDVIRMLDHIHCSRTLATTSLDLRCSVVHQARLQRGLHSSEADSPLPVVLSTGRLLLEDTPNAYVADIVSTLRSKPDSAIRGRVSQYFLANHVVPLSTPYLSRFLSLPPIPDSSLPILALLGVLDSSHLCRTIVQMRTNDNQSLNISPDALLAQPLYTVAQHSSHDSEHLVHKLLRCLRLLVAATTDYGEPLEVPSGRNAVSNADRVREQNNAAIKAIALVETIRSSATSFLDDVSLSAVARIDIDKMLQLVAFGRFLRQSVQSATTFNFSLAFAIVEWIRRALRPSTEVSPKFIDIADSFRTLDQTMSLTSGLALTELWKTWYSEVPLTSSNEGQIAMLEKGSRRLAPSLGNIRLRIQVSDVMSMWALRTRDDEDLRALKELTDQITKSLESNSLTTLEDSPSETSSTFLQAQLRSMTAIIVSSPESGIVLRTLLEYAHSDFAVSLNDLLVYKRMSWSIDLQKSTVGPLLQSQGTWLAHLWDAVPIMEVSGPTALCRPVELASTALLCDGTKRPMNGTQQYELSLKRRLSFLSGQLVDTTSRLAQLGQIVVGTALTIAACISNVQAQPEPNLKALDEIGGTVFQDAYQNALRSHLQALLDAPSYTKLGRCWVGMSRLLLELYVPNIPIDPAMIQRCAHQFTEEQHRLLLAELALHRNYEQRTTGRQENPVIAYLSEMVDSFAKSGSNATDLHPPRADVVQLHAYWTEVSQFLEQVVSPEKIDAVLFALENGENSSRLREQVIQESTSAFLRRLENVYGNYADINEPIRLALLQLKLGLRFVAEFTPNDSDVQQEAAIIIALTSFPSSIGTRASRDCVAYDHHHATFPIALWRLSVAAVGVASGIEVTSYMPLVEAVYEQSLGLWLVDKARKEEAERESQSLYRHKTETNAPVTEAEAEEQEFLALFPEYEDLLDADHSPEVKPSAHKAKGLIDPLDIKHLASLHQQLFGSTHSLKTVSPSELNQPIIHDILTTRITVLPEQPDQLSRPYQISSILERLSVLRGNKRGNDRPYNFYRDPNALEIRKSSEVLERMSSRLYELVLEWPDQMVLQHLKARCDAVLTLDIFSPIAKVLSAIEQLLMQMEDWEMYANKENTLKTFQNDLANLVVSWRRLELASWQGLLRTQAQDFSEGVSEWWFQLYEATVRGLAAASHEEESGVIDALSTYLDGLIPLLDSFITSSPLGQYLPRLGHLQAFEAYLYHISAIQVGTQAIASRRAHRILHFTRTYYSQFVPQIIASISSQQGLLEKDIRDFIKLASWKDINVHALKQSAQRTHRQLYKCVRKFKEILRQPVTPFLTPGSAGPEESTRTTESVELRVPANTQLPPSFSHAQSSSDHLVHLERTFRNFQSVVQERLGSLIGSLTPADVEDLAGEIITTTQSLAAASPPAAATKVQKEKFYKSLLVRKRKTWSDLLKELKRIGLAVNMKPEVLERQSNPRWLREQPVSEDLEHVRSPFGKSETYLFRLTKLLPELRAALASHHDDIGLRDLQRGTSLVESAFSLAVDTRASFVEANNQYKELNAITSRLHQISQSPRIVASDPGQHDRIINMRDDLGRLTQALEEIATVWTQYLQECPDTDILPGALEEVQSAYASSKSLYSLLADVASHVKSGDVYVLLEDEAAVIQRTFDHIQTVVQLLSLRSEGPNIIAHFVKPVLEWLKECDSFAFSQSDHLHIEGVPDSSAQFIDRVLLSVQAILALSSPTANIDPDASETPDRFLRDHTRLVSQVTSALKIRDVQGLLASVMREAVRAPVAELEQRLARVLPFLETYAALVRAQLASHCAWTKALFKLDYVICSVVRTVARDGFCKPPESGEGQAGEGMEDAGGMGIGEGAGAENVSKEIEDESQVEGLQGETDADEDVERAEEGDALEMSEDFGGKMQDVPEEEEGEGEEEEDDEDVDPEEQVGDLDAADPSAVDEKLWGDESGPDDAKQDEGKMDDHSTKQQEKESEMTTKDDQRKDSKEKQKRKEEESGAQEERADGEGEGEETAEEVDQEEPADDGEREQDGGAPLDDFVPEANTLDLPDDMDFGKEEDKDTGLDDDIEMDDEDGREDEADEEKPGSTMDEDGEDEDGMDVDADNPQAVQEDTLQPEGAPEDVIDGATAQPDLHAGAGQDSGEAGDQAMADASQGEGGQGQSASGEVGGAEESAEREQGSAEDSVREEGQREQAPDAASNVDEVTEGKDGSGTSRSQKAASTSQSRPQPLQSNPLRSLGDALREIRQRMDVILESEGPQPSQEQLASTTAASQLEYLRPEEDTGAEEMQALGPAQQEDVAKLDELKYMDEAMDESDTMPPIDDSDNAPTTEPSHSLPQSTLHSEPTAQSFGEDVKSALTQTEIRSQLPGLSSDPSPSISAPTATEEPDEDAQKVVELALRQWQEEGQPEIDAEDMWRKYETLTHDLSYTLCEQLRLILEPTMATRLRGDYRTGKRLNMKKIIPYIASEFTKDKIWLRRTRPSQREYQVLVALDDSRSMAESHSVHLAFQTLALVAHALGKLEVGDVAIARFGEAVDVLHGFDGGPFTRQAGARVMRAFRFDQRATQVLSLVDASLEMLARARERRATGSGSAADLWQLEIIISDGICQDHDALRAALRRAEEQRVMVVFVILDSLHSKGAVGVGGRNESSILSMTKPTIKMVDGRAEVEMARYLDTFPFEYYVVLRDVEALPDVLAGTLKQFFERIAEA